MKKHLYFSLLVLLPFQIILYCSTNRVGAVDADTDTLALLSFKSVVSDSQNVLSGSALGLVSLVPTTELEFCHFVLLVMGSLV